jgi:site-specific recombinase XerD
MDITVTDRDREFRKIITKKWLTSSEAYIKWMDSLKTRTRNGKLSKPMKASYTSTLKQFLLYLNSKKDIKISELISPDSFIEWAKEAEPDDILRKIIQFDQWLQGEELEDYHKRILWRNERIASSSTASQKAHGTIRGFITHNKIYIPPSPRQDNIVAETKKSDQNYQVFKVKDGDIVKDFTLLRYLLSELNFRDRVIMLSLLSTSQDISDLLTLSIGFVKNQERRDRLYWTGNRIKTGQTFRTFFSKEATQYLRRYINQEREDAGNGEPIFISSSGESINSGHVNYNLRYTAEKMGIEWHDKAQNPFRPKRMRSIFAEACYQAGVDDGARHIFMGHARSISESYREIPTANLEVIYSKLEPYLTIYVENNLKDIEEARNKSEQAWNIALELKEQVNQLKDENTSLRRRTTELEKTSEWLDNGYLDIIEEMGVQIRELTRRMARLESTGIKESNKDKWDQIKIGEPKEPLREITIYEAQQE